VGNGNDSYFLQSCRTVPGKPCIKPFSSRRPFKEALNKITRDTFVNIFRDTWFSFDGRFQSIRRILQSAKEAGDCCSFDGRFQSIRRILQSAKEAGDCCLSSRAGCKADRCFVSNEDRSTMNTAKKTTGAAIAVAAAALLASAPIATHAGEMGKCMGANSCKGHSSCKTATSSCKGLNACKGQGFH
jgi:hypothetical protein